MNTNNGHTKFNYDTLRTVQLGRAVSEANRLVKFDNDVKHAGSSNTCDEPYRLVLNIDYFEILKEKI